MPKYEGTNEQLGRYLKNNNIICSYGSDVDENTSQLVLSVYCDGTEYTRELKEKEGTDAFKAEYTRKIIETICEIEYHKTKRDWEVRMYQEAQKSSEQIAYILNRDSFKIVPNTSIGTYSYESNNPMQNQGF